MVIGYMLIIISCVGVSDKKGGLMISSGTHTSGSLALGMSVAKSFLASVKQ